MQLQKLMLVLLVFLFILTLTTSGDTAGGSPFQTNDKSAAELMWDGRFIVNQKKTINIEILDKSYIHKKFVNGKMRSTITFLVFHDTSSGWGKSIQNLSRDKFTGPGGYVEKTYLPVTKKGDKCSGKIVIVPQKSIRAISIWKDQNQGEVHVGYNIQIFNKGVSEEIDFTSQQIEKALQIHKNAWEKSIAKARTDPYYKFSLYSSRSLAVKHPEIYLKGDALFMKHITSTSGFSKAYNETNNQSQKLIDGYQGLPFSLNQVDLSAYSLQKPSAFYPNGAPFLNFLDLRVEPMSTILKNKSNKLTSLEKAFLLYFIRREKTFPPPYIIYSDKGRAYLATYNKLISVKDRKEVNEVSGKPILIFNEYSVWYPLMDRDDTDNSKLLKKIVNKYANKENPPSLDEFEKKEIIQLKKVTSLKTGREKDLATIASIRTAPWSGKAFPFKYLHQYPEDIWHAISASWIKRANYLSPFSSYLAALIDHENLGSSVEKVVDLWHWDYGYRWGHIWKCGLVEYSIDEVRRIHHCHCVTHGVSFSSILDLANVRNILIKGTKRETPGVTHIYVAIPKLGYVISNGFIENRGTVINADKEPLNYLWLIAEGEKWAMPYINYYCGNWSPKDLAETLENLMSLYGDTISSFRSSRSKSGVHFTKEPLDSKRYISSLYELQPLWNSFQHP